MRIATVIGMLAVAGCNQIFGLAATDPVPDGPRQDAFLPRVKLTWQVVKTLQDGPDPAIEFAPIEPAPLVRIGRIDGPLTETMYQPDGSVEIPEDYPGTLWRLEYTIDNVAYEVHWSPARNLGHVIVPRLGRLDRDAVPAGGGYAITPTGGPATHPNARVYTTGVWTDGNASSGIGTVNYPFSSARSLGGPLGAPDQNRGDDGVLVDLNTAGCTVATGSASFATPAMSGTLSPATPSYSGNTRSATVAYTTGLLDGRLGSALNQRKGTTPFESRVLVGHIPSTALPGFTERMIGLQLVSGPALPGPALLALADCSGPLPASIPASARPTALTAFPLIVHSEFWDQRRPAPTGPIMVSGIAASMTSTTETYTLDMRVPFALEPLKLGTFDLAGPSDQLSLPIATGRAEVTYMLETGPAPHYFELVLHEVVSGGSPQLIRKRVYTSAMQTITFDTSVLTAGKEYVLSIHTHLGRPDASTGDYTKVSYPQAATTIFTRTFVAQ